MLLEEERERRRSRRSGKPARRFVEEYGDSDYVEEDDEEEDEEEERPTGARGRWGEGTNAGWGANPGNNQHNDLQAVNSVGGGGLSVTSQQGECNGIPADAEAFLAASAMRKVIELYIGVYNTAVEAAVAYAMHAMEEKPPPTLGGKGGRPP